MVMPPLYEPLAFIIETAFTILAVIFCSLIYIKTKESYELTKYQGIKYFRDAFLFFGLSYLLRFVFSLIFLSRIAFDFILPREIFIPLFILPLGYFSTIGIFYLIFSLVWKKFNNRNMLIAGHGIAILLSLISFNTRSHFMLIYLQSFLLVIAIVWSFLVQNKKLSQTKILYILVFVLWLINLLILGNRHHSPFDILAMIVSIAVFITVYYKIVKRIK